MPTFKLTWKRGQRTKDVLRGAGAGIAGSDAIEVNIDITNMSKGEVLDGLEHVKAQIIAKGFPQ